MTTEIDTFVRRLRQAALPDPFDERDVLHAPLLREAADEILKLQATMDVLRDEVSPMNETIDRLRGQLQNCVAHLEGVQRRFGNGSHTKAIESANKALYETLHA